jgi:hypothetical protein
MNELKSSTSQNNGLFIDISRQPTIKHSTDKIISTIGKVRPINIINMNNDIGEISISIRTPPFVQRLSVKNPVFNIPV